MSKTIDERVVSMQFDNKHFESNVQTSLGTIDKLKQSLNLTGATKGLENVNDAAKNVNMAGLGSAVETVRAKFSALEIMGVTALANITNSAVNAGKRIVSALTIDPIKTGFSEYETQINAVQTILANTESKGTTLQQVNSALDQLNTYADKTIYNFTEMTKNIGTFTAAGVDLDTSVNAIQGIANLAAVSGSTSQQASTAMYQLSQALSSGTVKLMDWNSVVNAGMGGQVFQDALKETARTHGVAIDEMIKEQGSFRETLQKGWLTSEILTETLSHFTMAAEKGTEQWEVYKKSLMDQGYTAKQAEAIIQLSNTATDAATKVKTFTQLWDTLKESAQSGWTQTWEIIMGDFEEAKGFLTEVSDKIGSMIGTSSDARNAMLSGGLSSGWKQLLGAGIADEAGYKDMFKSVAKEHEVSIDDMIAAEKKLDESLSDTEAFHKVLKKGVQDGTLTSEMFSESVHKMADKMSKMSAEELKAAGYTQEHVTQIKEFSKGLKDSSVSMDEFVTKMSKTSGRENIIQALWNAFNGLLSVVAPVKEAFREIFPPITGEQLYKFTETLVKLSEKLTISDGTADKLKRTFKGLFAILDIAKQAFGAVFEAISPIFGGMDDLGGGILDVTARFGDWLVNLNETIKTTDIFGRAAEKISNALIKIKEFMGLVAEATRSFISNFKQKVVYPGLEFLQSLLSRVKARMDTIGEAANGMKSVVTVAVEAMGTAFANCDFIKILKTLWNGVKTLGLGIAKALGALTGGFVDKLGNADFSGIFDLINTISFAAIGTFIAKFVKGFSDVVESVGSFKDSALGILDEVRGCFEAYQTQLKAGALLKIASAIAILVAAVVVLTLVDSEKLSKAVGAITLLFADLMTSMAIVDKLSGGFSGVTKISTAMIAVSLSVLILASALKKIADLEPGEMATGLIGVIGLTGAVVAAMIAISKFAKGGVKGAVQMVIFAAAIKILASVCKDLGSLDLPSLGKGLLGVGVLLTAVSLFLNKTKFSAKAIITATGIVILGAALKILVSVCKDFAQMDWESIAKGLVAVGAILFAVAKFTKSVGNPGTVIASGLSLIAIAASMKIFASAAKDMAQLTWEEIGKGLAGMAVALAAVTVALRRMPQNTIAIGAGLVVVASALMIMSSAISKIGSLDIETLIKGVAGLAVAMGILVIGLNKMKGTLGGSAAMLVAASALLILTPALLGIGSMGWESIAKGLITIAAAFAIIGVAGFLLRPLIPAILGLSAAFALMGVGVVAIGAGLVIIGAGLSAVAVGFTALGMAVASGATAIVAGLTVIIVGIAELIPLVIQKLGEGLISLCRVIAEGAPVLGEAIKAVVLAAMDVLVECVPVIIDGILPLLLGILTALAKYTPQIVDALFDFVVGLLQGLANRIPDLIQVALNLIMSFFTGIIDAIRGIDVGTLIQGLAGVGLMAGIMVALSAVASLVPGAMVGVLGMGAVIAELALVLAAIGGLAQIPGLDWLISEGGALLQDIGNAIGGFVGGIIGGIAEGITASLPQIGSDLSAFMINAQPFITGAQQINPAVMEGVKTIAGVILAMTAANLIDGIAKWITGESSISKFASELPVLGVGIAGFARATAGINPVTVVAASTAAKALADMTAAIPNEGGVVGWFAGENSISKFASELPTLGVGIAGFARATAGINPETVTAAANAAKTLAAMTSSIPNEGGVVGWFAGENSISKFASDLSALGSGLAGFATNTEGVNPETVVAASDAAKTLADMTGTIPNEGGVAAWFAGENSVAKFGEELPILGAGLKGFATEVEGIKPDAVVAAANAAKALSEMTATIPNEGGVVAWFTGDNSISKFGKELPELGEGLKGFSDSISGISPTNVVAASDAAKSLAEMTTMIPNEGGVKAWFTGDNSISTFAGKLPVLGEGLKGFSDAVAGINPTNVNASVKSAKEFISLTNSVPDSSNKLVGFGENMVSFGVKMKEYFASVATISSDSLTVSRAAINTIKKAGDIDTVNMTATASAIKKLTSAMKTLADIPDNITSKFTKSMTELSKISTDVFLKPFDDAKPKMKRHGSTMINEFVKSVKNKEEDIKTSGVNAISKFLKGISDSKKNITIACNSVVAACVGVLGGTTAATRAGANFAKGFANGISSNTYQAVAKARAMAKAAANAAKKELDEHSPSKVGYGIGAFFGIAFVNALRDYASEAYTASTEMARSAKTGLSNALETVKDLIENETDSQPTITPVLDLTNVSSGVGAINSMLDLKPSLGMTSNIRAINTMMHRNGQNGVNGDVVSAIDKLRKDLGNIGSTSYNIAGISYNGDADVEDALRTIIRAARVERRS